MIAKPRSADPPSASVMVRAVVRTLIRVPGGSVASSSTAAKEADPDTTGASFEPCTATVADAAVAVLLPSWTWIAMLRSVVSGSSSSLR